MLIGELSERSGASARSIRYYESVGLLTSRRATNGYREFDATALGQIAKIKLLLQVGLDVTDIVKVLPCVDTPSRPVCSHAKRRYDEQIERIERQQRVLAEAKSLLLTLRSDGTAAADATADPNPESRTIRKVSGNAIVGIR